MKKLFVAVMMVMGLGTSMVYASNTKADAQVVMQVNDLTPIDVKDLPQAIQDTLKKDFAEVTVKEAAVEIMDDGAKVYKVTLTDKEGNDSQVSFNENGEVLS